MCVAASPAAVLGEGGGLVDESHRQERRAGDDLHAPPAHVLQEGVVEAVEHLLRQVLPDGAELVQDAPQGLLPHLAQGDLRDLGSGSLDLAVELRLPIFRLGKLLLEVGQRPVGCLELALLVGELGEDVVELPLEGFLLPEQGIPSVRSGIRAGEAPPDAFQFPFYPGPSRLQVGHHRPESLDAYRCQSDLPVEPFEFGSPADHLALQGAALGRQFAPVLLVAFLLRMGHGDAVTALQPPLPVDLREQVVECQGASAELVLVRSAEDFAERDPAVLCHGHQIGMDMGCPLVQVDDEGEYVLLPELAGKGVVHVLRPPFDFRAPLEAGVIGTL